SAALPGGASLARPGRGAGAPSSATWPPAPRREADVAFEYTVAIPTEERGIRLFCLWPLLFAVLTLRELEGNPAVLEPAPIKIGREAVQRGMKLTRSIVDNDEELRAYYPACSGRSSNGIAPSA